MNFVFHYYYVNMYLVPQKQIEHSNLTKFLCLINHTVLTYAQRVALGIDYLLNVTRIVIFYSKRTKPFVITILVVIQIMKLSNLTLQIL